MNERLSRDLEILLDLFKQGGWREVSLTGSDIELILSASSASRTSRSNTSSHIERPTKRSDRDSKEAPAQRSVPASTVSPGWHEVVAPNLGTFYRSPKPGSPPFVEVGQKVSRGSELCLVEVMKLFTSVRAEVSGIVRHIAAADAELVDSGQALMYIEVE